MTNRPTCKHETKEIVRKINLLKQQSTTGDSVENESETEVEENTLAYEVELDPKLPIKTQSLFSKNII